MRLWERSFPTASIVTASNTVKTERYIVVDQNIIGISLYLNESDGAIFIDLLETLILLAAGIGHEVMLFAAMGLLVGGIDEFAVDIVYFGRATWRRMTVYRRFAAMTTATLSLPDQPGRIAIFVPAWREADVIGPMLWMALNRWGQGDYRIFVGTYPNDRDTIAQVAMLVEGAGSRGHKNYAGHP